ncbi:MAG TPA: glycosyltransferase 87 family protein, partial [Candidatus Dormibacteraeota bacterium]|nr:glycosyltransferase 87 family protein [Candidatus Dormibacteraeota bacterium]
MAVAVPGPSRRAHFALGLALAAGLAVRLLAAPFHGFFGDLQDFADWGNIVIHHFGHAYSYGGHPSDLYPGSLPPAFPPLSMYAFGASVRAYLGLRHLAGAPADVNVDVPLLAALMKLPSIAADLAVGLLAFGLGREARGAAWGALLAALWLLSPVGAFDGALWGQVDVLPLPFLIAAIALAARGRGLPAGVCLGLALLWKPQAALLAPLVLLHLLRWRGPRPAMVAAAAAAAVNLLAWLPYLGGEVGAYQANVAGTFRILPFASSNAYNLWWLLGLAARPYTSALAGPLTINAAGWGLFGAVALVAALRVLWCAAAADLYIAGG